MDDDPRVVDRGWDALPEYSDQSGDADDAVTVSISTTPGEWLVNTVDSVVVPMSMAEVVDGLRQRKLNLRSLVWRAGMQEWAPVDNVPQLKLAARIAPGSGASVGAPPPRVAGTAVAAGAATATPLGPPPSAVTRAPSMSIPPKSSGPPNKTTPAPRSSTPAPHALPSRRSTLPFGLPSPHSRPSSPLASPRPAIPPTDGEEPVLAVYDRPAATISFELAPVPPQPAAPPHSAQVPQTLAPTTSDAGPRPSDLSVVAASHFRDAQRSSKRLIVISSVASAAAASLLTFFVSHRAPPAPAPEAAAVLSTAAAAAAPQPVVAAPEPAPEPAATPELVPSVSPPREQSAPKPKPRRTKAVRVAPKPPPPPTTEEPAPSPRAPADEPNPYDVKLEDDAPPAKPSTTHGSGLEGEAESSASPAATGNSATPGF